jgi:hypothetical protein
MTSHRTIFLTLTLLAALVAVAPSSAFAGPLLSGYGGPGEGNQAILGSTLIGGAGGGSGSSGGSSGSDGSSSGGVAGAVTRSGQSNGALSGSHGHGSKTDGTGTRTSGRGGGTRGAGRVASAGAAHTYQASPGGSSSTSQAAPGGLDALGLSGADLLYVLLAFGALGVTGVLTRRLTRMSSRPEGL